MVLAAAAFLMSPASGHHSDAGVDTESIVAFEGTVKEFVWKNPHVYVVVATGQGDEAVEWELQMAAVNVLSRRGWTRDALLPGDHVMIRANPAESGRPYGILQSVEKEGGLSLAAAANAPDDSQSTTTLAGKWLTDRSTVESYPGGFDGFFHALLSPNEKGTAAQKAFDPLSDENPEASCVGRPTPSALVSTALYLMEIDLAQQEEIIASAASGSTRSGPFIWMVASIRTRASVSSRVTRLGDGRAMPLWSTRRILRITARHTRSVFLRACKSMSSNDTN